ncbi:hypothetical protein HDU78_011874, partial [Chytriomyces hyalinus]
ATRKKLQESAPMKTMMTIWTTMEKGLRKKSLERNRHLQSPQVQKTPLLPKQSSTREDLA